MKSNPFIPMERGKVAIVDGRISEEIEYNLKKNGLDIIKTKKCINVEESISYHPDIVIHPINHDTIIVEPSMYDYYKARLANFRVKVVRGNTKLGYKYPKDIAYNVGRLYDVVIHNFKHTDSRLLKRLNDLNLKKINIKQGYSKCSLMIVDGRSAITCDIPMFNELKKEGYNVLLVEQGHINLPGQKYGFIGGCTGNLSKDEILISGHLKDHPNGDEIKEFIRSKNKKLIYLSSDSVIDIGTIIILG